MYKMLLSRVLTECGCGSRVFLRAARVPARRDFVTLGVVAALVAGDDVISFYFHITESMADAAAPMTFREQFRNFVYGEAHSWYLYFALVRLIS